MSVTLIHIAAIYGNISYYVTTTIFLAVYYKVKNAEWSDEYSVHKINPDIHLMCELYVIMKLCKAAGSLSDADSHFLP
jgi:hypothetical protein